MSIGKEVTELIRHRVTSDTRAKQAIGWGIQSTSSVKNL